MSRFSGGLEFAIVRIRVVVESWPGASTPRGPDRAALARSRGGAVERLDHL